MTDQLAKVAVPGGLLEAAFDLAPFGVAILGKDGKILLANHACARLLGTEQAALTGTRLASHPVPTSARLTITPVTADLHAGITDIAVIEDIGAQKETDAERGRQEARLRQAQKMEAVGRLSAGIAHDFNNMLTVILASAELLDGAVTGNSSAQADLAELRAAARRGSAMVRKLLGFSRRERLTLQSVKLSGLLNNLGRQFREILPHPIELEITSEHTPDIRADPWAVEEILVNLLTNARDALPKGGRVHVHAGVDRLDVSHAHAHGWGVAGEYVCITVTDTGTGMDEVTRGRLFEPFFTTKPPGMGTGLGLAMVYGLVKQQNGFILIDSAPDRGTTVRIYFPAGSPIAPRPASAPKATTLNGTETILLVDDEEPVRRAARRVLERFGYQVLVSADGAEALAIIQERAAEIHLVISDVAMPRMGGRELYDAARASGAKMKFLFASGYTARDLGATEIDPEVPFVHKPWTVDDFLKRVRETLDDKRP